MDLSEILLEETKVTDWLKQLNENKRRNLVTGLVGSAKTLFLQTLFQELKRPLLIVTSNLYRMQELEDDLKNQVEPGTLYTFPVEEVLAAEMATSSPEFKSQRVQALNALASGQAKLILTSVSGLRRKLPAVDYWRSLQLKLTVGSQLDLDALGQKLTAMGYRRQKLVERPGDFAIRGEIVDVYPVAGLEAVRIDFFDTEIDSLRTFDVASQRSIANLEEVSLAPASDFLVAKDDLKAAGVKLVADFERLGPELSDAKQRQALQATVAQKATAWQAGALTETDLPWGAYLYPEAVTLLDYLSSDGLVIVDDYSRIVDKNQKLINDDQNWQVTKLASGELLPNLQLGFDSAELLKNNQRTGSIFLAPFAKGMGGLRFSNKLAIKSRAVQQFFGQMPLLKTESERWRKQKQTVVILVTSNERLHKVEQTLTDFDIQVLLSEPSQLQKGNLQLVLGGFRSGFELTEANLIVLTEHELFAKVNRHQARRQTMSNEQRLKSYTDLKVGDYVVHVNHGIGKYLGMETIEVSGRHQDYMTLLYKDDAKLFIPVSQIDRIQKYVSSEAKQPQIASLTSDKWRKTKSRVARKIEDIADELVELYAKRESEQGYAFSKDDSYQKEFEDAFPYTETPDQLRSSQEIKRDMEMTKPMDRLLIGDVGFGKTEVALRAAFKAIQDGKQVAFLAPTTVLVQQHYETILNRFDGFPVSVGILSRFSSPTEVKQTLQDLRLGLIDIIVGTHRLLSKDVKFADLGLLIIDEEQRFGVKHKERLKELKASVDVLTLTATPIPRTLNLSMLGVRDLSVIETAPLNRYPIQTYVLEQNFGVIIDGIKRELARGGQVFYLHNRVEDIESVANEIRALVADARVAYIHGQMTESQLERVLMDFIAGEYDVLVTTTIIETGVDIPNANTLFVENADKMGLAQLYQLRGRVGRSNRIAYAYFMYQPDKVLTETGEKRLEAIKDFTELGSGFKIAMRDLAIRGAGNILGKQQHGFIDSVGYDLYTQMLNTAIAKKQGKKVQAKTDAEINLEIEAYLPTEYIEDARQKIEIYKRIGQFENLEQYREVQTDLIDRFGDYPQEVANLLEIGLLKMYADLALIEKIKQTGNKVTVLLAEKFVKQVPAQALLKVLAQTKLVTKLVPKKEQVQIEWVLQPTMDTAQELSQLKELAQLLGKELQAKKG